MKKLFCLLLILAMAIPAFAETLKADGHAPEVTGTGDVLFNQATELAFQRLLDNFNDQLSEFNFGSPKKFLEGMANSSVYASHGATTRGYGGYKLFSATVGLTVGLQLPKSLDTITDDINKFSDALKDEGDLKLGFSPNLFNANIGLNMGMLKILPEHLGLLKRDNLYVGLRIGYFKLPDGLFDDIAYKSFTFGVTANYQIIPTISLAGLVKWRGVNVGTGFIYNNATANFIVPIGDREIEERITSDTYLVLDPKLSFNVDVSTFTIPLEAVTAIKLLIFNIPFGLGADLAFGKTSVGFGLSSDVSYKGLDSSTFKQTKKGELSVGGGVSNSPSFFNFKIMTGLGINAGPVVFDVPVTIYPASGYNIGLTIGAVF